MGAHEWYMDRMHVTMYFIMVDDSFIQFHWFFLMAYANTTTSKQRAPL